MSVFSSQSSGFGTLIVGGIVAIVAVTAGLSAVSKGLFEPTSAVELNEERRGRIHDQAALLASLKRDLIRQKRSLAEQERLVKPLADGEALEANLEILNDEVADLQLLTSRQDDELEEIENKHSRYRQIVRGKIWSQYLNKELKAEYLLRPLKYQDAKISRIDPAGLMVMHRSGAARVKVAELSPKFRKVLDLDLAEARAVMAAMLLKDARGKKFRSQKTTKPGQPSRSEIKAALDAELAKAVVEMEKYVDLIRYAEETAETARRNDRFSSKRSVPGKLETWAGRARKFDQIALGYRARFSKAAEEVRALDPDYRIPRP